MLNIDVSSWVLFVLLAFPAFVMMIAWRQADFKFAAMLTDDAGKPSATRLAVFVCIAGSTWALIRVMVGSPDLDKAFPYFACYMAVWSGAKVAEKALDVLLVRFGGGK